MSYRHHMDVDIGIRSRSNQISLVFFFFFLVKSCGVTRIFVLNANIFRPRHPLN